MRLVKRSGEADQVEFDFTVACGVAPNGRKGSLALAFACNVIQR